MKTAKLTYVFKNVLTSKWKTKNMLLWERGCDFISTENKRLCMGLCNNFSQIKSKSRMLFYCVNMPYVHFYKNCHCLKQL